MIKDIIKHKHFAKIMIVVIVIVVIAIYVRKAKKEEQFEELMKAVKDPSNVTGTAEDLKSDVAFDPNYYKSLGTEFNKRHNLGGKEGDIAKSIFVTKANARIGVLKDYEQDALSALSKLKSKSEVSYISKVFNDKYGERLIDFLKSYMGNEGNIYHNYMKDVYDMINRLPNN